MTFTLRRAVFCLLVLALSGCVTREPTPQDLEAKRFIALPDKAVVYLFRDRVDLSDSPTVVMLDDQMQGSSYRGTYFRFELEPGRHRFAGYAGDIGRHEFTVERGAMYFMRHSVAWLGRLEISSFQQVPAAYGRSAVLQYELNGR